MTYDDYEYDRSDRVECYSDPDGESALRKASKLNPRNLPCPTCGKSNKLTPADRALGYQCDNCASLDELGW
jgi:hypothetical protein